MTLSVTLDVTGNFFEVRLKNARDRVCEVPVTNSIDGWVDIRRETGWNPVKVHSVRMGYVID